MRSQPLSSVDAFGLKGLPCKPKTKLGKGPLLIWYYIWYDIGEAFSDDLAECVVPDDYCNSDPLPCPKPKPTKCKIFDPNNPDHQKDLKACAQQAAEAADYDEEHGKPWTGDDYQKFMKQCMEDKDYEF